MKKTALVSGLAAMIFVARVSLFLVLILVAGAGLVHGQRVSLEVKAQYFQSSDGDFRDIYGPGVSFGGEIDVSLSGGLGLWAGGHYFSREGKLTFTEEETRIRISPFYGGIRFRFGKGKVLPYVGAGIGLFSFKEENPIGTVSGSAFGYIGQGGLIFRIGRRMFLDLKGSYASSKANPAGIVGQIGGFLVGLGVGVLL